MPGRSQAVAPLTESFQGSRKFRKACWKGSGGPSSLSQQGCPFTDLTGKIGMRQCARLGLVFLLVSPPPGSKSKGFSCLQSTPVYIILWQLCKHSGTCYQPPDLGGKVAFNTVGSRRLAGGHLCTSGCSLIAAFQPPGWLVGAGATAYRQCGHHSRQRPRDLEGSIQVKIAECKGYGV